MSMSRKESREYIMEAPAPMDGAPIWARFKGEEGYSMAARAAAKAMLLIGEEDPDLLDAPPEDDTLWNAAMARWPELNDWLGGITGFQHSWAVGTALYVLTPTPVEALSEVELEDE